MRSLSLQRKRRLSDSSHEFTKEKSYLTALIDFNDGMAGRVDDWKALVVVFSKVFDTVSHKILRGKLRDYVR